MVRFMPDPLSHEEFETLKQIGVVPVKMAAANHSERRPVLLGFAEEALGLLALTGDGMMRIAKLSCRQA
jgi:hypothetical protein